MPTWHAQRMQTCNSQLYITIDILMLDYILKKIQMHRALLESILDLRSIALGAYCIRLILEFVPPFIFCDMVNMNHAPVWMSPNGYHALPRGRWITESSFYQLQIINKEITHFKTKCSICNMYDCSYCISTIQEPVQNFKQPVLTTFYDDSFYSVGRGALSVVQISRKTWCRR